ncbi:hypothetical protein MMC19_007348 [Ptychographa xylographoides]|nr:hypothetical protein [Ptychographa xylographoides]
MTRIDPLNSTPTSIAPLSSATGMDAHVTRLGEAGSDYGSDFGLEDEDALAELSYQAIDRSLSASTPDARDVEGKEAPHKARWIATGRRHHARFTPPTGPAFELESPTAFEITYDDSNQQIGRSIPLQSIRSCGLTDKRLVESDVSRATRQQGDALSPKPTLESNLPDLRSPLERFRTKPMKPLSVTDLVSPSWCELQYWFTLTKHGRKRRTSAMKQGSIVHKILEDQVHRTVEVDLKSREDAWGLRIWNVIEGLRTLRETGMTRELEVWGVVDGLVVNGVIDELSNVCPDKDLEEEVTAGTTDRKADINAPAADQLTIKDFLQASGGQQGLSGVLNSFRMMRKKTSKIYLTDVKTRSTKTLPKGASFRPTLMQLMLYHLLLSNIATNKVNANVIFDRYELDADANFSDGFIAQLSSLNETCYEAPFDATQSSALSEPTEDPVSLLLEHNSLRQLWDLMVQDYKRVMPAGLDSIGTVLKVEYRDQVDGSVLGLKTFLYDPNVVQKYINDQMRWWKGERDAKGVVVEEAYKCRSCDFADGCGWRISKVEEATNVHRTRSRSAM